MDSILKFAKDLLPLLQLYPARAKLLFLITALACGASVITFVLLYQGAEKRLSVQTVGAEISAKVDVLTQPVPAAVEKPKEGTPESHHSNEGGIQMSVVWPPSDESLYDRGVKYLAEKIGDGLRIRPSVAYISTLAAGGPITDLDFNYSPFPLILPVVDLKVVNNSSKTIFFTDAVFEVAESRIDATPILLIPADGYVSNAQHIRLVNEGWGLIEDCVLRFNLVRAGEPTSYSGPFQNEVSVKPFAENTNLDISSAFERAGVNNAAIKALQWKEMSGDSITVVGADGKGERTMSREQYRREQVLAFGKFSQNTAVAQGEIVYSSSRQSRIPIKFSARVYVMNEDLAGAPAPPSAQYDAYLRAEGDQYTVDVPISQAIKAGEFDRFTFRVGAPKSSLHRFQLKLLYNGGEVFSAARVELQIFMPRSTVRMFESASKGHDAVSPN